MARGSRLAGESSPFSLGLWIAILDGLAKYKLFWFLLVLLQTIRGLFKHYMITLGIISTLVLWYYTGTDIITVFGVALALAIIVIVGIIWVLGGSWKTPYYYLCLKLRWRKAMFGNGLKNRENTKIVPEAYHIRPAPGGLQVRVNMGRVGRGIADLAAEENEVAEVLKAHRGNVGKHKPGIALYTIQWDKELSVISASESKKAAADAAAATGDSSRIVIGKGASGPTLLSLKVSLLIVGVSRAGKTTIIKAVCQGLRRQKIPHVFNVIDPKGGIALQELEYAPNTVAYTKSGSGAPSVIRNAYDDMQRRFEVCRELGEDHLDVSEEYPLVVIIIDELLRIPEDMLDVNTSNPLAEILANGAAVGIVVIAGSQLSQVDAIGRVRDLFAQRICLRTSGPDMTDACLGRRAEMNGAACSKIPASTPGVGYIYSETEYGLRRFRSIQPEGSFVDGPVVLKTRESNANRRCAVYKYYNAVGRAWYFGNAYDPHERANQHAVSKFWWPHVDHNRTEILWYTNKAEAEEAESAFIAAEDPVHNQKGRVLEGGKNEESA